MFQSVIKTFQLNARKITITSRRMTSKESIAEKVAAMSPTEMVKNTVKVSDWNKRLMVFAGRYKNMADIPNILPFETVDRARNMVRIRVCNIMIVMTLIGCITMAISGKRAAESGESVMKMNLDWHREYNENAKLEEAKK